MSNVIHKTDFINQSIKYIGSLMRIMTGLAFAVLMLVVLIQVATRTFGSGGSPVWTEELTRFSLLYIAAFGAGLSFWTGAMVNVDMLCERLPKKVAWSCRLISAAAVCFFALYLLEPAWRFTKVGMMQTAASMPLIKMAYVHASVLILLTLLALASGLRVLGMLLDKLDGLPELREEETL